MVIPVKSAVAIARHLLPVGSGSALPVAPKLPDLPAALSEAGSFLTQLLGLADDRDTEGPEPSAAASSSAAVAPPDLKDVRMPESGRSEPAREHRSPATDEPARPAARGDAHSDEGEVRQALQNLEDLKNRGALPTAGAAAAEAEASPEEGLLPPGLPLPEGVLPDEAAPEALPPALPPPLAAAKYATAPAAPPADAAEAAPLTRMDAAAPGSGSSRSGAGPARTAEPAATPADVVDRIVKAARLTQSRGLARIKIVLSPPHLGELKIDLSVRQHVLQGRVQAQSPAAQEMILSQLDHLRETLENQGIHVGGFQVTVDQSFQQASGRSDGAPPPPAAEGDAPRASETMSAAEQGLRSARVQVLDVVA